MLFLCIKISVHKKIIIINGEVDALNRDHYSQDPLHVYLVFIEEDSTVSRVAAVLFVYMMHGLFCIPE